MIWLSFSWVINSVRCIVIFLHDNAPSHTRKPVRGTLGTLSRKFYPMQLTHQTWLFPITTCLHQWVMHLLSSAFVHTQYKKMARWMVHSRRERFLPTWHTSNQAFFIILINLTCYLKICILYIVIVLQNIYLGIKFLKMQVVYCNPMINEILSILDKSKQLVSQCTGGIYEYFTPKFLFFV